MAASSSTTDRLPMKIDDPLISSADISLPDVLVWRCVKGLPDAEAIQAATMLSLSLGAGHSFEARSMLWAIFRVLRPGTIVETGTNHGLTTAFMSLLGHAVGRGPEIVTLDLASSSLATVMWKALGIADSVRFVQGDSGSKIPVSCRAGVQFALVDGDHSYSGGEPDWRALDPLLDSNSVTFFDNMQHPAGCGRFFSTLSPLCFHPEMAFLPRGLSFKDLLTVFASYSSRVLPLWLMALPSNEGPGLKPLLAAFTESLVNDSPRWSSVQRTANLCAELSALAARAELPPASHVMRISARYGIGTAADAKRQQIKEMLPTFVHPFARSIYRLLKTGAAR